MHSAVGCLKILQIHKESRLKYLIVGYDLQQKHIAVWNVQD